MQNTKQNKTLSNIILTVLLSIVFLLPISYVFAIDSPLINIQPTTIEPLFPNALEPVSPTSAPAPQIDTGTGYSFGDEINLDPNQPASIRKQTQPDKLLKNNSVTKNAGGWEQAVGNAVLAVAASITWLGGKILQTAIEELVFGMGTLIKDGIGYSIDSIWSTIRDISNLAFIFGFIYVGIRTIINPDSADTKRFLAQIIIGALLINFSLFFTKIVIDFSNFSAVQIYNAMTNSGGNLSEAFAQQLGITSFYAPPSSDMLARVTNTGGLWFYIMGAIMLVVAGFVLAAGGILLIVRFVALIFIMMFSPILFAATIFPQTEKYATDLWAKLISYSFFAPVYLLLLLTSITVLKGAVDALGIGKETLANGFLETDSFDVILNFVIVIMFLIFSLQVAQKMGIKGGEMAVSAGKNLRQRGQRALGATTAGLTARAGRATLGRLGNNLSEKEGLKDAAAMKGVRGFMARQALKGSRAVGDASFDARNVAGAGEKLGIGEGRKGGYTTVKKEVKESEEKFARSLGEVDDNDVRVQARKQEMQYAEKQYKTNIEILKEQLKSADPAKREKAQEEIDRLEKAKETAKIDYEKEKQRRIIGSTYAKPTAEADRITVKDQKDEIKTQNDKIKAAWKDYVTLKEDQKEAQRPIIEKQMKELKILQEAHRTFLNQKQDTGYAGVRETSAIPTAWPAGRLAHMEKAAGEAMRKTAEKGLPKEKDH